MRNKKILKHLIVVIKDKLTTMEQNVNNYEFLEAEEELSSLCVNMEDLHKELSKCLK